MIQLSPIVGSTDFGAGYALAFAQLTLVTGEISQIKPPRMSPRRGGSTDTQKFLDKFAWLMSLGDAVTESSTPGSSGAEPTEMQKIVANSPHNLYTISCRKVKNYKLSYPEDCFADASSPHLQSAMILAAVARDNPAALHLWTGNEKDNIIPLKHRSVRPYDKRSYRGPECDRWMSFLPNISALPAELQLALGDGSGSYSRPMSMPFGMLLADEDHRNSRTRFEKILGLNDHGHGNFYRRKTVEVEHAIAKHQTGKKHNADISPSERKNAWRTLRPQLRMLFHLAVGMQTWKQGIDEPATGMTQLAS